MLLPNEFAKKSADFQLTQIFHEPGYKNEYLLRTLVLMLSRLTKYQELTSDDLQKIQKIEKVKHRIEREDPVLHLLTQVKTLSGLK